MLSAHVGQGVGPPLMSPELNWGILLVHTLMAMCFAESCSMHPNKNTEKVSLSLSFPVLCHGHVWLLSMFSLLVLCLAGRFHRCTSSWTSWREPSCCHRVCRHSCRIIQIHACAFCSHYMSRQLNQVSCMLLGACVVRVWPTHLWVLSGQEIQMLLLWFLRILCLLHQVLSFCCKHVVG